MVRVVVVVLMLGLAACGGGPRIGVGAGTSSALECAPFARDVTGIQLYGHAASWWAQAEGRYERDSRPIEGGVLVFRRSGRLPYGHVSVVARRVSGREIAVTQANWVRGQITRNETVLDVSPGNDWSLVRVWWAPSGALGTTVYPTHGFIGSLGLRSAPGS